MQYLKPIGLLSLHSKSGPAWKPGIVELDVPLNLARSWDKKGVKGIIKCYGLQLAKERKPNLVQSISNISRSINPNSAVIA